MTKNAGSLVRMPALAPIEHLRLEEELDGSTGSNRANGHAQIAATTDVTAVTAWLANFISKRTTFDSYRKEAERLLLWAVHELRKPLSSLTHEDLLVYQRFMAELQPGSRWVLAAGHKKVSRHDPEWRPFAGPLSASSQRQAMVVLNSMFSWLVDAGYLRGNPVFPISQAALHSGWINACRRAGIEGLRFHDLRHEATSRIVELGWEDSQTSAVTGHKTLQMLKNYTHLRALDLAKKLG